MRHHYDMTSETEDQTTRAKFYGSGLLASYVKAKGVPKSRRSFGEMVTSITSESLEGEKSSRLIATLNEVVFFKHPQQINIMDKSNGKLIAQIPT